MKKTIMASAIGAVLLCLASYSSENGAQVTPSAAGGGKETVVTLTGSMDISRTVLDGMTYNV